MEGEDKREEAKEFRYYNDPIVPGSFEFRQLSRGTRRTSPAASST
jgi:hypothetical protein